MRKTKSFQSVRHQYFYPELKRCPHCRQRLCLLQGLYLKKTIQTLDGVLWLRLCISLCQLEMSVSPDTLSFNPVSRFELARRDVWTGCDCACRLATPTRSPHHE